MRKLKYYIPTSVRHTILSDNKIKIIVGLLLILLAFALSS
jgi:hypothetical protein